LPSWLTKWTEAGWVTAIEAARLAVEAGVDRLVLTHISGRYPADEVLSEATAIFPSLVVAADFDKFSI
jgi:ribonuclease Z